MGRLMSERCTHGRFVDWGDFGPRDEWGQGCEECGIAARKRCGNCEGQGVIWAYYCLGEHPSGPKTSGWSTAADCQICDGTGEAS